MGKLFSTTSWMDGFMAEQTGRSFSYRVGEYFSGAGGLSLGAVRAAEELQEGGLNIHIEPVWAVDSSEAACVTYENYFNSPRRNHNSRVLVEDVRKVDPESLEDIDGFLFGFPCNDFSIVGKRKGTDGEFGPLYQEAVKVLKAKRPKWFVAENVTGIRSANSGNALKIILEAFASSGYRIFPEVYKFEEYGVPQTRHRMIVVGIREDLAEKATFHKPAAIITDPSQYVTASRALSNIPPDAPNNTHGRVSRKVQERLSHIKPGQNAFNADIPEDLRLNIAGATLSHIYRKLDPDKPSYTLTANGGGGTHGYHWDGDPGNIEANRPLTHRERARLQTFPDDFVFHGTDSEIRSQVGMAVPPEGAKYIFMSLLSELASSGEEPSQDSKEDS